MVSLTGRVRWLGILAVVVIASVLTGLSFYLHRWGQFQPRLTTTSLALTFAPSLSPNSPQQLPSPPPQPITTVLFTGDLMFDRHIRAAAQKQGNDFIFAPVRDLLLAQDVVVTNLEGPITANPSKSLGSLVGSPANYIFTFDPGLAETLYRHNIRVVNLGNNHILNFGQAGLEQTLANLAKAKVAAFGYTGAGGVSDVTGSLTAPSPSYVIERNQQRIALINYNQFTPGSGSRTAALAEIGRLRPQVDWIVIYAHWDNEYQPTAAPSTVQLAHTFIEAGADLIIGSHPHVIQNHEVYQGKNIYYSLGNFVFDQYFEPAVRKGLLVKATFQLEPAQITVQEIPVFLLGNGQSSLVNE